MSWKVWAAVAVGGACGASLRYAVALWLGQPAPGAFPRDTLLVNVAGSLLLGILLGLFSSERLSSPVAKGLLTTGFCGALTTFSTFSLEAVVLLRGGHHQTAALYLVANLVLCLLVGAIGLTAALRWSV